MQYNVHTAKSQLSKLIDAALKGEEVVIAKGGTPMVRLVALPQNGFRTGLLTGLTAPDDLFDPLGEDELTEWE